MSHLSIAVGRILLGLYFLLPGFAKVSAPAKTIAYMQSHDIAFAGPLMWFSAAVNIIGGLMLITGRHVRFVAYGFVVYIILVNLLLHHFWDIDAAMAERETQNFFKNLGILAGLLILAGAAHGRRLSLKGWWRSDTAVAS